MRQVFRTVREERRARRERMCRSAIQPTRIRRVIQVETQAIPIPQWAWDRRVHGLSESPEYVWLERKDGLFLARLDREAGGTPRVAEVELRKCPVCGRPLLAEDAAARRVLDESAQTARQIACGPDCLDAAREKRWSVA